MKQNKTNSALGVYVVEQGQRDKSYWTKVGVAFPHKDDGGFNLTASGTPLRWSARREACS